MEFKIFPWEKDEKPFWINPENGYEWYIDKSTTEYCSLKKNNWPKLNAICFYVCEKRNGKIEPITRVLIDKKTNNVLAESQGLEQMLVKIEVLRMIKVKI